MNDNLMRKNLVELLKGGHAHVNFKDAVNSLEPKNRNVRPEGNLHSVWELLEHIRIGQEDILRYTLDPNWKSPKWPDEYWPKDEGKISDEMWHNSIKKFDADLNELIDLTKNSKIDVTSEIPHGEGRTYLREIMMAANHNSYHVGQIVSVRKLLDDWK
jgi:uncharacterized damage-inducible protein DinB